jgi:hypothetical protein
VTAGTDVATVPYLNSRFVYFGWLSESSLTRKVRAQANQPQPDIRLPPQHSTSISPTRSLAAAPFITRSHYAGRPMQPSSLVAASMIGSTDLLRLEGALDSH